MKFFTGQKPGSIRVDRAARRINGIAVATRGDANGDIFDDQTLALLVQLGNASVVRAREDHPNRANPAEIEAPLEKLLGRHVNFRIDQDVCRCDCQLAGVNLEAENRVMDFAEKTPELFGLSVVIDDPPPPGKKPKKGERLPPQPCRPVALFAADFVDIPASNAAGLFAAVPAAERQTMDPADIYAKDGKLFCMTPDGKELPLNHTPESLAASQEMWKAARKKEGMEDPQDDPELDAKKKAKLLAQQAGLTQADIDKAKTEAIEQERGYRRMFGTIVKSAKLDGAAAEEFEKNFYGRAEADLKFLAQHAIGERAKPLGEGSGNPEPRPATETDKAAEQIKTHCAKRFAAEPAWRRRFGVNTANAKDPAYQAGLEKFIAVETKCRADEAGQGAKSSNAEPRGQDPIDRVLKNKSMIQHV